MKFFCAHASLLCHRFSKVIAERSFGAIHCDDPAGIFPSLNPLFMRGATGWSDLKAKSLETCFYLSTVERGKPGQLGKLQRHGVLERTETVLNAADMAQKRVSMILGDDRDRSLSVQ